MNDHPSPPLDGVSHAVQPSAIVLSTLNARYRHTAIGLRYLRANLGPLREQSLILEFDISQRPLDIAEKILAHAPRIVGLSIAIWNVGPSTELVALLKRLDPHLILILGGPEVSHETEEQRLCQWADYVIQGEGEIGFRHLCQDLLAGRPPSEKVLVPPLPDVKDLVLPYGEYTREDCANRQIYVEASRGCPYLCHFCLSALDKKVRPFPLAPFLAAMATLLARGVRQFKFIDRTFNLSTTDACTILDFFLARPEQGLFLHFEVVPDRLPEEIAKRLQPFPPGSLQLEVGIQTFNPTVLARIGRSQDLHQTLTHMTWLRRETRVHLHADLILGLPGESLASIGASFDQLLQLDPHDIQVGILKRLRGAPIHAHTEPFRMIYNPNPPYDLLCNDQLSFATLQRLKRFARYWDLIGNSGRFGHFRQALRRRPSPFADFLSLSDWLFATLNRTHKIALMTLFEQLHRGMLEALRWDHEIARDSIEKDFRASGRGEPPPFLATTTHSPPTHGETP